VSLHLRDAGRDAFAVVANLALVQFVVDSAGTPIATWSTLAIASIATWAALSAYRRYRVGVDLPTSRIGSAAQGYVELRGVAKAHPGRDLRSPHGLVRCVWFRYVVEERTRDSYRVVRSGSSHDTFVLRDDTGECVVDPDGARVDGGRTRRWDDTPYRITEVTIADGDPLYALGQLHSDHSHAGPDSVGRDAAALLSEWKRDRAALNARFDVNGDGTVDLAEWDVARETAQREALANRARESALPPLHVLSRPDGSRPFVLSTRDPGTVARRWLAWTLVHSTVALIGIFHGGRLLFGLS
jgi:hypothetical protein